MRCGELVMDGCDESDMTVDDSGMIELVPSLTTLAIQAGCGELHRRGSTLSRAASPTSFTGASPEYRQACSLMAPRHPIMVNVWDSFILETLMDCYE